MELDDENITGVCMSYLTPEQFIFPVFSYDHYPGLESGDCIPRYSVRLMQLSIIGILSYPGVRGINYSFQAVHSKLDVWKDSGFSYIASSKFYIPLVYTGSTDVICDLYMLCPP